MAAYGTGYYGLGVYGIGNVVISGNSSTGAAGNLLENISVQEDGNIATGNVGTVGLTVSIAITGNDSIFSVGSVLVSPIITGTAATGDVGTLSAEVISFQDITGVEGTEALGTAAATIEIVITGVGLICAVGTMIGYGWGAVPDSSESWTPVADTSETWTDLADNSITWQEAA